MQGQGVIKPIACRPMVSSSAHTTPILGNRIAPNNEPTPNSVAKAGLYSSTSDLSRAAPAANKLRFSWSKPEAAGRPPAQQGRVADLSRRFGGSLSNVAPPNSPAAAAVLPPVAGQPRQPPAYRPPPSSRCTSKGSNYSSSELHLDRALRPSAAPSSAAPQWALGGSEINLSSLMSRYYKHS